MHPYYYGPHLRRFGRGPSRLLWFILGGVAASWWIKHKEMRTHERYAGFCHRKPVYPAPPASVTFDGNTANQDVNTGAQPAGSTVPVVWGNKEWEEEKDRMWAMGRQAGDTVSPPFFSLLLYDTHTSTGRCLSCQKLHWTIFSQQSRPSNLCVFTALVLPSYSQTNVLPATQKLTEHRAERDRERQRQFSPPQQPQQAEGGQKKDHT